jgi:hypothetical protein
MPTLVSDLIQLAFEDLAVVQTGELISPALQADGFSNLVKMMASLSTEGATVFTETPQVFTLSPGTPNYTLGPGGTWATSVRAQRIIGWKATNGASVAGGAPLPYDSFDAAASSATQAFASVTAKLQGLVQGVGVQIQGIVQAFLAQVQGMEGAMVAQIGGIEQVMAAQVFSALAPYYLSPTFTFPTFTFPTFTFPTFTFPNLAFPTLSLAAAAVPMFLAADTSWPLINIRVFPAPIGGNIEVVFWTPITAFATVGDTVNLPPGFEEMLHFNLSLRLYPKYARVGGIPPELAANAQNSKAVIVAMNSPIAGQPPHPYPQGQIGPAEAQPPNPGPQG